VYGIWLKDESLSESGRSWSSMTPRHSCIHAHQNLPDPDVLAAEIVEDLEAALEQFREIATDLMNTNGAKKS
jgi:type I restriction enzyme M protein